jgi:hypothetical protein
MAVAAPQRSTDDLREGLERGELPPISAWHAEVVKLAQEEAARGDAANIEKFKQQCDRLIGFTEYRYPRYRTSPHHRFIATHLERVERREIDRLMILMPPRHGKSELASKSYPAWTIGRNPWKQFISASATADLAHVRHARRAEESDRRTYTGAGKCSFAVCADALDRRGAVDDRDTGTCALREGRRASPNPRSTSLVGARHRPVHCSDLARAGDQRSQVRGSVCGRRPS